MIDLVKNYSVIARRAKRSIIRELLKLTEKPDIISLAGGLPDPATFPHEEIKEIASFVLDKNSSSALQYSSTEGNTKLINEIVKWKQKEGLNISAENVLITSASQQALDMLGRVFIDASDPIIVELPSYVGGLGAFTSYGAKMVGVPMDEDGVKVDLLRQSLENLKISEEHYKLIYLVPDFQNPAGITLSEERRKEVIKLSREFETLIVEDSPYRELRYEGIAPKSIYELDNTGNVVALNTFSKIFVPGFRLGWVIASPEIIKKLVVAKQNMDLCTANFNQCIAAEFMSRGLLEPHIEKIKKVYEVKRKVMLDALDTYMPKHEELTWTKPDGGLFLWLTAPSGIDTEELFTKAIEKKVAYIVGTAFHCDGGGHRNMRLNFSFPSQEQIVEGIKRLGSLFEDEIADRKM
ncbi:MAG: PLP-dependent aminotransferase family protein [Candidatus Coatesbacteria bacterium]|nr:PLP-dependent aminotransferase family protein [Candidatus Coatesbacteria bacterium]